MDQCNAKLRSNQLLAAQQMPNALHRGPIVAVVPSHEDIARRAYEIHVAKGRRQGGSEQDWLQAEEELKSQQDWLQNAVKAEGRDWAGEP